MEIKEQKKQRTYSAEFKLVAVKMHLDDKLTKREVASRLKMTETNIRLWVNNYLLYGIDGLKERRGPKRRTEKQKSEKPISLEEENLRLKAENEFLKKLVSL